MTQRDVFSATQRDVLQDPTAPRLYYQEVDRLSALPAERCLPKIEDVMEMTHEARVAMALEVRACIVAAQIVGDQAELIHASVSSGNH